MSKNKSFNFFDDEDSKKEYVPKNIFSKIDYDLFKEENDKVERIIRVKKIGNLQRGEKWKIFNDDKLIFTLDDFKLTKKEKNFLYTQEGCTFLINCFKNAIPTVSQIKSEIKKILTSKK